MKEFVKYNDGVVSIYREKNTNKSTFGAKTNVQNLDDMTFICKLDFEELSKRQQDQEFAEQNGFSLSMKVRTRLCPGVDNKCKAMIGNTLYDVSYLDKTRKEIYLYLEEVRDIVS